MLAPLLFSLDLRTRRFSALKLWMCFKFMGKRGYSETVERHIELTEYLAARLDELPDFERVGEIETAVCCFRYLPGSVRALPLAEQDRVQQQLQLLSLAFPAKMLAALGILTALTPVIAKLFEGVAARTISGLLRLMQ